MKRWRDKLTERLSQSHLSEFESVFPELALFSSKTEAMNALHDARRRQPVLLRTVSFCAGRLMPALCLAAIFFPAVLILRTLLDKETGFLLAFVACLIPWSILQRAGIYQRVSHYGVRKPLRQILQEKGIPICIGCGYDCRGLKEPRCPECGREFDPMLLAPTPERVDYHSS